MRERRDTSERFLVRRGLRELAARQGGVVRRQQGAALGAAHLVKYELESDLWVRLDPGIYLLRGRHLDETARAFRALLLSGPGVVVSHHSAAALWQRPGFDVLPLHTWRMRGANSIRSGNGLKVHETRALPPEHVTEIDGLPVTRPARTVFDLAAVLPLPRTEVLLDRLWTDRLVVWDDLSETFVALNKRGRRGIKEMKRLLDARGPSYVPPASSLERKVQADLEREGVTGLRRQVDLGGRQFAGRVDLLHDGASTVIEVQSERWHSALVDQAADAARTARLEELGLLVIPVWEADIFRPASRWAEPVARIIQNRQRTRAA